MVLDTRPVGDGHRPVTLVDQRNETAPTSVWSLYCLPAGTVQRSDECQGMGPNLSHDLNCLELLKRLAAVLAIIDRATKGRTKAVLDQSVLRVAVGTRHALEEGDGYIAAVPGWGRQTKLFELAAPFVCDPVATPRWVKRRIHGN